MTDRKTRLFTPILALTVVAFGITSVSAQDRPTETSPIFRIDRWITGLAFAPDGQKIACYLVLANLNGKELSRGELDKDFPHCTHVAFSPNGKWLVSVHFDEGLINAGPKTKCF